MDSIKIFIIGILAFVSVMIACIYFLFSSVEDKPSTNFKPTVPIVHQQVLEEEHPPKKVLREKHVDLPEMPEVKTLLKSDDEAGMTKADYDMELENDEVASGQIDDVTLEDESYEDDQFAIEMNDFVLIDGLRYENRPFKEVYNFDDAQQHCTELDLDGSSWRLPTLEELERILSKKKNKGKNGEFYINTVFVDNLYYPASFWTSNGYAQDSGSVWIVYFTSGTVNWYHKVSKNNVLCVN